MKHVLTITTAVADRILTGAISGWKCHKTRDLTHVYSGDLIQFSTIAPGRGNHVAHAINRNLYAVRRFSNGTLHDPFTVAFTFEEVADDEYAGSALLDGFYQEANDV